MRRVILLLLLAPMSGCQKPHTTTTATSGKGTHLPSVPFLLECRAGVGNLPDFAKRDFAIRVDPVTKTFAFPKGRELPLKFIDQTNIIMREETVDRGRGNNPESWRIQFDLGTGTLSYLEQWSGIAPGSRALRSECSVRPS